MSTIIKICKISYVLYAVVLVGNLIFSIIVNITGSDKVDIVVHTGGWQNYIPSFFSGLATVLFYYLLTVFVEKWCKKNDIA